MHTQTASLAERGISPAEAVVSPILLSKSRPAPERYWCFRRTNHCGIPEVQVAQYNMQPPGDADTQGSSSVALGM